MPGKLGLLVNGVGNFYGSASKNVRNIDRRRGTCTRPERRFIFDASDRPDRRPLARGGQLSAGRYAAPIAPHQR
jgi:hypothetical protein